MNPNMRMRIDCHGLKPLASRMIDACAHTGLYYRAP